MHALAVNGHPRPSVSVPALRTRVGKPASNQVASGRAKTRSSVSYEGFLFGSFRKVRSQVSLNREESDGHEAVGTTDDGWHRQHQDVR